MAMTAATMVTTVTPTQICCLGDNVYQDTQSRGKVSDSTLLETMSTKEYDSGSGYDSGNSNGSRYSNGVSKNNIDSECNGNGNGNDDKNTYRYRRLQRCLGDDICQVL
eukprot:8462757-Ditylum_brightwellii.AAC.1